MGAGNSKVDPELWSGTDENLATMIMPLYYVHDVIVTDSDISGCFSCWQTVVDGKAPAYIEDSDPNKPSGLVWFSNVFYGRLFDVNPEAKKLFRDNNETKARALGNIISTGLRQIWDRANFSKILHGIAVSHCKLGVKAIQYGLVGDVLLWSFAYTMKNMWDQDLRTSWIAVYSGMLRVVIPHAVGEERKKYRALKKAEDDDGGDA